MKLSFQAFNSLVRFSTYGIACFHAQHQLDSALKIQSQIDSLLHVIDTRWKSRKQINAKQGEGHYHDQPRTNSFVHKYLLFFRILEGRHCILRHLDFDVFRNPDLDSIVFQTHDCTVNTACSNDFVADLEVVDHLLELLLAGGSGTDQNEIEDDENKYKWDDLCDLL